MAFSLLLNGCSSDQNRTAVGETHKEIKNVTRAFVDVKPTKNNKVQGKVQFIAEEGGVRIIADIEGLTPGKHGFHVHEHGDCSAPDGSSAGGHFNPTNKKHGSPDSAERHVGDFGNLEANASGDAHYSRLDTVIQLNGPESIVGKSIVIHADPDDLTSQPAGNSGVRIACGQIEILN